MSDRIVRDESDDGAAAAAEPHAALSGVRVLDFSRMLPGPWCTQMLADMGADVIKVEQPGIGDLGRHNAPNFRASSVYFATVNLNKRSIALDLTRPDDVAVVQHLIEHADVIVESFRGGVAKRLGIDYEAARARNPSVIYCSVTGFGQHGPFSGIPGHDLVIQATSGVMGTRLQEDHPPAMPGFQAADYAAACYAVIGILAALNRRNARGEGAHLDISMFDCLLTMTNVVNGTGLAKLAGAPAASPMQLWGGNPRYATYATKDGKAVAVSLLESRIWAHFCRLIAREDLIHADERPEDRLGSHGERAQHYRQALTELCLSKTRDELVEWMVQNDVPILPVYSPEEAVASPHAEARGLIQWIDHPDEGRIPVFANPLAAAGLTTGRRDPAPALGESTDSARASAASGWPCRRT